MKLVFPALIAICMLVPADHLAAQTLATPPANTTSTATPKQQDPKLGTKINAIIKKQNPEKPASDTKGTAPAAKPAAPATASSEATPAQATPPPKPAAPRRESKVDRLITEREQLVLKYDYFKTQSNNFWGKASKEDMRAVIEALKEVLQKDEQIIQAVEQANLETRRSVAKRAAELEKESKLLNNQVRGDKRVITDNIYDLKASVSNAQNLLKSKDRKIKDLEEKLQDSKDAKFEHDAIAAFFAMLCLLLIGYIIRLRGQVANSRTSNRVKA
ncbi:hypothetical protein ACD591_17405 [Rufibacter glacialis]|uniref:Uncharacterized protein n=1 Tax=Rufibacter glacialis TaxID=1259555 RepID=A0A5M8QEC2_9BACT|nr:hypothetical protein [Rufibacter glacialis]KAA6434359.1 hypothetical protein FOE74_09140 [Rufibacter glacialis]GGK68832.1 hypothetical protein GCM10011405_16210 [Rufibacter glacialis]